jgi:signal transduction histidine kinase
MRGGRKGSAGLIAAAWILLSGSTLALPQPSPEENAFKRVLVIHSFGPDYFQDLDRELKRELARRSPERVELFEVPLEVARFSDRSMEAPFVDYLRALVATRRLDLVVSIALPAARFSLDYREALFPETPLVLAAIERRILSGVPSRGNTVAVPVTIHLTAAVENILRVAPDTAEIFVVLGRSAVSKLWLELGVRELTPLTGKVRITWLLDLPLDEILARVSALPPRTAVLFAEYAADAGVVNQQDRALESVARVSSAPVFGMFESQLGLGIVGGPLISEAEIGRRAGAVASRILSGEAAEKIEVMPVQADNPVYDFRALERWSIEETILPPGSTVLFRPPSLWSEHRTLLLSGLGIVALQTGLIGSLLLSRRKRRLAEDEARALARRLLTAHEDERSRLARELHDDLSQRLARLSIDAARMERSIPTSGEKDAARTMRADLVRLGDDVHALAYQLHPSVLDDLGLNEALRVECEQFSRRESIHAELTSFEAPLELPSEVAVCLFRIAQEALRNVAKHSRAKHVRLAVTAGNGNVRMTVRDDGIGFVPAQGRLRSLGHASMRERAQLVGGTVEVESSTGRGTTVQVSVPHRASHPSPVSHS